MTPWSGGNACKRSCATAAFTTSPWRSASRRKCCARFATWNSTDEVSALLGGRARALRRRGTRRVRSQVCRGGQSRAKARPEAALWLALMIWTLPFYMVPSFEGPARKSGGFPENRLDRVSSSIGSGSSYGRVPPADGVALIDELDWATINALASRPGIGSAHSADLLVGMSLFRPAGTGFTRGYAAGCSPCSRRSGRSIGSCCGSACGCQARLRPGLRPPPGAPVRPGTRGPPRGTPPVYARST